MLKRISGLIGFVILSFTVATYAQLAVGDWQIYTSTGTPVKVIDTPQRVYYVSGRSLFGFDKETEEMESYSKNNILKKRTPDSKIVRRHGRLYVINKKNPKYKQRQG